MPDPVIAATPAVPAPSRAERMLKMIQDDTAPAPAAGEPTTPGIVKNDLRPPEVVKPEEKAPEGVPDRIKASFDKLAQREAAFRKEHDAAKPYLEGLKVFSPGEVAALSKAKTSGNALAALTALGFSYADVAAQVVEMGHDKPADPKPADPKAPAGTDPALEEMRKEIAELKAEKAGRDYKQTLATIEDLTKDKPLISKLKAHNMIPEYVQDFYNRTGKHPGDTFEESVAIAAEAVEMNLMIQAKRFAEVSGLLTPPPAPPIVSAGTREAPSGSGTSGASTSTTLTNADAAPPRTAPKSREDRLKELANDPTLW